MDQYSPKSSPMGSRSPSVAARILGPVDGAPAASAQNVESSGLKMTISLKHKIPFYLMKHDPIPTNETTGATNLMASRGLEHSYNKLTTKKMKDTLSSFLQNMPGIVDTPASQDNSSLRGIIEKPPVGGKEIVPLNQLQLAGFRLHPGPLPEQYRSLTQVQNRKKHKKKHKHKFNLGSETPLGEETTSKGGPEEEREKKREKKHKKHDKDAEDRKKRKKEKKKKKNKDDKDT